MRFNYYLILIISLIIVTELPASPRVIIAVIDGARYSETFGSGATYIPNIWNNLRPQGTIYTSFYNDGYTETNPGHSSIITGTWQHIANDGSERPHMPTIFEYFREQLGSLESDNYVVTGKSKLNILTYSTYTGYGSNYRAAESCYNVSDQTTYTNLVTAMDTYHPDLIIVNFADVDRSGHTGNWTNYTTDIQEVDGLIYNLWDKIQNDSYYQDSTTLFVTNDHGRHDDAHGGFTNHGDDCEGCRHIILLALGRNVPAGQVISDYRVQTDLAPTVGDLIGFSTPYATGTSLYIGDNPLPVSISEIEAIYENNQIFINWVTASEIENSGFNILKSNSRNEGYQKINSDLVAGHGNSSEENCYAFIDSDVFPDQTYFYKIQSVSNTGKIQNSEHVMIYTEDQPIVQKNSEIEHYNYPNPFNSTTEIRFKLRISSNVQISVYNKLGQIVQTYNAHFKESGWHQIKLNISNLASDIYYYQIETNIGFSSGKMTHIK